ncbi:hypothetical protein Ancab_039468 [Ancistrocladus abbreviatus]
MAMDAGNRLSAIAAEMGQLQNEIQEHHRVLNFLLRSVRTMDPARKEARIRATREHIEGLEGRQQALRAEQEDLIVLKAFPIQNSSIDRSLRPIVSDVQQLMMSHHSWSV